MVPSCRAFIGITVSENLKASRCSFKISHSTKASTNANSYTEFVGETESLLRRTTIFKLNENLDKEDPPWAEQVPTLMDVSYKAILSKLRTISFLSDSLHQALEHRKESERGISTKSEPLV